MGRLIKGEPRREINQVARRPIVLRFWDEDGQINYTESELSGMVEDILAWKQACGEISYPYDIKRSLIKILVTAGTSVLDGLEVRMMNPMVEGVFVKRDPEHFLWTSVCPITFRTGAGSQNKPPLRAWTLTLHNTHNRTARRMDLVSSVERIFREFCERSNFANFFSTERSSQIFQELYASRGTEFDENAIWKYIYAIHYNRTSVFECL